MNGVHLQAKLAKLRRELLEPSTGAGAGGGGKGEGMPSCYDVIQGCLIARFNILSPVICQRQTCMMMLHALQCV